MEDILGEIFGELIGKIFGEIIFRGIGSLLTLLGAAVFSFCVLFQTSPMQFHQKATGVQTFFMFLTGLVFLSSIVYRIYTFL